MQTTEIIGLNTAAESIHTNASRTGLYKSHVKHQMFEENDLEIEDAAFIEDTIDWFSGHIKKAKKGCIIKQLCHTGRTILPAIERYPADVQKSQNFRRQAQTWGNANTFFLS